MIQITRAFNEVVDRVQAPTPTHFKRIIVFGLSLVALGLVFLLLAAIFPTPMFLALEKVSNRFIEIGLTMAGVSVTARDDKK